ncbi:DUF397 domain-containing protein [Streptomyces sp. NPDC051018]|uniref:DUF397 domain-containing protein n=1 Tax=Streptomyces sp. NPDC051018 TaxID=3365639 RepID=UPI0037B58428
MTDKQRYPVEAWRKSSYSGSNQGECLEVMDGGSHIPVRDSKNPHGPVLAFPDTAWDAFIQGIKNTPISL